MPKETLTIVGASVGNRNAEDNDIPDIIYFDGKHETAEIVKAIEAHQLEFSAWVPQDLQSTILDQLDALDDPNRPTFSDLSPFTHQVETAFNFNGHFGPPILHGQSGDSYPIYLQGWHSAAAIADQYPGCTALCTEKDGRAVTEVKPDGFRPRAVIIIKNDQTQ